MAPNSHPRNPLLCQLRELYGRMIYTHKAQEKEADLAKSRQKKWQNLQLVISTLTTTGVIATIFGDCLWVKIVAAILSAVLFGISAYLKNSDFGGCARQHAEAAAFLWDVREQYLTLIVDLLGGKVDEVDIRKRRDCLQEKLAAFFKDAPRTSQDSYTEASAALQKKEEFTFSDKELDNFLPEALRLNCQHVH